MNQEQTNHIELLHEQLQFKGRQIEEQTKVQREILRLNKQREIREGYGGTFWGIAGLAAIFALHGILTVFLPWLSSKWHALFYAMGP